MARVGFERAEGWVGSVDLLLRVHPMLTINAVYACRLQFFGKNSPEIVIAEDLRRKLC
jgi:hypothetical protein